MDTKATMAALAATAALGGYRGIDPAIGGKRNEMAGAVVCGNQHGPAALKAKTTRGADRDDSPIRAANRRRKARKGWK